MKKRIEKELRKFIGTYFCLYDIKEHFGDDRVQYLESSMIGKYRIQIDGIEFILDTDDDLIVGIY